MIGEGVCVSRGEVRSCGGRNPSWEKLLTCWYD